MKYILPPTQAEVKERKRIWKEKNGWREKYDFVWRFSEGLAPVRKNEMCGFVNRKGEEVIPLIYDYVHWFFKDKAWVRKNGKYFYIDHNGERIWKKKELNNT